MKSLDTYKLPPAVSIALQTNRAELIRLDDVASGKDLLFPNEQAEVLRLVKDLIEDRRLMAEQIEELRKVVKMAIQTSDGNMRSLEAVMESVRP